MAVPLSAIRAFDKGWDEADPINTVIQEKVAQMSRVIEGKGEAAQEDLDLAESTNCKKKKKRNFFSHAPRKPVTT